jgi:hypothetical protein
MTLNFHDERTQGISGAVILGLVSIGLAFYIISALQERSVRSVFRKFKAVYYSRDEQSFSFWITITAYVLLMILLLCCTAIMICGLCGVAQPFGAGGAVREGVKP